MEKAQSEIAREIERVHEESYGAGLSNIKVEVAGDVVVIIMDVEFNRAEETLVGAGFGDAVRESREAYQEAIEPTFKAIVERATGRRVESFASRMIMDPPWSAEVFRLTPTTD